MKAEISILTNLRNSCLPIWYHTTNSCITGPLMTKLVPQLYIVKCFFCLFEIFFCEMMVILMHIIKIHDPFDDSVRNKTTFPQDYDGWTQVVMRPPV